MVGVVYKALAASGQGERLSDTAIYCAAVALQTSSGGEVSSANVGTLWVGTSAAVDDSGDTGYYLVQPNSVVQSSSWTYSDPCARNNINLQDIWIAPGVAGDGFVALYWVNPALSDRDILIEMQYHLLETPADGTAPDGTALATTTWTLQDWVNELDSAYKYMVGQAQVFNYVGTQAVTADEPDYDLSDFFPSTVCGANEVDIVRLAFLDEDGVSYNLQPSDPWAFDHLGSITVIPNSYSLVTSGTRTVKLSPTPAEDGTLHCIFTGYGLTLDGYGTHFSLPDEIVPFVKWGAMATLLSYDGQGQDPTLSAYCQQRWEDGMDAAKMLTGDWYV